MATIPLSGGQLDTLRQSLLNKESSGNYKAVNQIGYVGGYQLGAAALTDLGYVKSGTTNSQLKDASRWNKGLDLESFLNDSALQDQIFQQYTQMNYNSLLRLGVVNSSSPVDAVSGYLATSHLLGPGGARKLSQGVNSSDANGTTGSYYYNIGAAAANGTVYVSKSTKVPSRIPTSATGVVSTAPRAPKKEPTGYTPPTTSAQYASVEMNIQPNPLDHYSSYNSIFTFSVITPDEYNNPDASYKAGSLGAIIFRSGGGYPENRIPTAFDVHPISNPNGKFEFYIDNVEINTIMSYDPKTQASNHNTVKFDVLEPFSMGMFLQTLQIAARGAGYYNYLEAVYLLTVEFIGFDDLGNVTTIENTTRHFPLKMTDAAMTVSGDGCRYHVSTVAHHLSAVSDLFNEVPGDISISGTSVQELLQSGDNSLQKIINDRYYELASPTKTQKVPDEIVILFPLSNISTEINPNMVMFGSDDKGATLSPTSANIMFENSMGLEMGVNGNMIQSESDMNAIGRSPMGNNMSVGGTPTKVKSDEAQPDGNKPVAQNKVVYDATNRSMVFKQGTTITNIITQVVLNSGFCANIVQSAKESPDGLVDWFRIETQTFFLKSTEANLKTQNRLAVLRVYKVIPYTIHASRLLSVGSKMPGYDRLTAHVVKQYNYLYSGVNVDILKFDLNFKASFYNSINADGSQLNMGASNQQRFGAGGKTETPITNVGNQTPDPNSMSPMVNNHRINDRYMKNPGIYDSYRTVIAKQFHQAMMEGTDMITASMTIMGDPYYLADSGMGNYSNSGSNLVNITDTGAVDYQNGQVDIIVNYRTPIDIGDDGNMSFGGNEIDTGFSGLYFITKMVNRWSKGVYTQDMDIIRRPRQAGENAPAQTNQNNGNGTTSTDSATNTATLDPSSNAVPVVIDGGDIGTTDTGFGECTPDDSIWDWFD